MKLQDIHTSGFTSINHQDIRIFLRDLDITASICADAKAKLVDQHEYNHEQGLKRLTA